MAKKGRPKRKIEVEKNFSLAEMKPEPKIKKGRFAPHEESYIRGHYVVISDREIGSFLNREPAAITRKRQSMQLGKNQGRPSNESKAAAHKSKSDRQIDREMYDTLSRDEKKIRVVNDVKVAIDCVIQISVGSQPTQTAHRPAAKR